VRLVYPLGLPYNEAMAIRRAAAEKRRTLYIKNPAAHRLAEQVGKRMGVGLSDAVIAALEEKLRKTGRPIDRKKVDALCARIGTLPVVDGRTPEEILGYDAFGIPDR
jgi:antitoxin VapB